MTPARELPVDSLSVRVGVGVAVTELLGKEILVGPCVAHRLRFCPSDLAPVGRLFDGLDAVLRHRERQQDLAFQHLGVQQLQGLLGPRFLSFSSFGSSCLLGCMARETVAGAALKGDIGCQNRRCRIAIQDVLKHAIAQNVLWA